MFTIEYMNTKVNKSRYVNVICLLQEWNGVYDFQ